MEEIKKYTEDELVMLLKKRQPQAFEYLYNNYSAALYAVILSIVPNKELANDTLQEVFLKIWRQIESYDDTKGRLFTWMMNVARNASIDILRSKTYQNNLQNRQLTDNVYELTAGINPNTDKIGLRKIVHLLKDDYKVLIELSYFQGYTQEEISKILEIPLGTVKTRLRTALIQLRQLVKP